MTHTHPNDKHTKLTHTNTYAYLHTHINVYMHSHTENTIKKEILASNQDFMVCNARERWRVSYYESLVCDVLYMVDNVVMWGVYYH